MKCNEEIKEDIRNAEGNIDALAKKKQIVKGQEALIAVYQELKWVLYRDTLLASLDAKADELERLRQNYKNVKEMLTELYNNLKDMVDKDENWISIQVRFAPAIIQMKRMKSVA